MKKQLGGGVYYRGDESVENLFKEKSYHFKNCEPIKRETIDLHL